MSKDPIYKGLNPAHRNAIQTFENAVRAHTFRGAQHPSDARQIEQEFEDAKKNLVFRFLSLYKKHG